MPTEHPRMPGETYEQLLRYGSSRGLSLQAGEVACFRVPLRVAVKRMGLSMLVVATIVSFTLMLIGLAI